MPWANETAVIHGSEPSGIAERQRRLIKQTDFGIQIETVLEATDADPGRSYIFESVEGPSIIGESTVLNRSRKVLN